MATVYRAVGKAGMGVSLDGGQIEVNAVRWFSSEVQAKAGRKSLAEELNLRSYKEVEVEQVDIPTSKAGIIEWLNANHTTE